MRQLLFQRQSDLFYEFLTPSPATPLTSVSPEIPARPVTSPISQLPATPMIPARSVTSPISVIPATPMIPATLMILVTPLILVVNDDVH